jgi:vacuolar protein sorting-associated protein 26
MSSLFSFTVNPTVNIFFNDESSRTKKSVKQQGKVESEELLIYGGQESVSGSIEVVIPPGKKIEHQGIKIEMIGHIGNNIYNLYLSIYIF